MIFSEITLKRFRRFKTIRRAYYSFLLLTVAYLLALVAEVWIGARPLLLNYKNEWYIPLLNFYPSSEFGGKFETEADYRELNLDSTFIGQGGWMLLPLIPHDPYHAYLNLEGSPPHAPSFDHPLGTDSSGRDVLARLVYGFRLCMTFSLLLVFFSGLFGILIGGIQGYFAGKVDIVFQRMIEIWMSLPMLYIVILLGSIYGRNFFLLLLITAAFNWIGLSFYMRGEFFRLRNQTFVKVARAFKFSHSRIFFKHILPNALTPVVTILPFTLISGITALTALDFLGFGLQPPTPSWGELLKQALDNLYAPWLSISTISALFFTLLLATFVGEGVREAFDPKTDSEFAE